MGSTRDANAWLHKEYPRVQWSKIWHRIDRVYDSVEHLCECGTEPVAQNHFRRLYPDHLQQIEVLGHNFLQEAKQVDKMHIFVCKSGHHRSVAFVEILREWLLRMRPYLVVEVWHLDHRRRAGIGRNLDALQDMLKESQNAYDDCFETPLMTLVKAGEKTLLSGS